MSDRLLGSLVESAKRALASSDLEEAQRVVTRLLDTFPGEAASHGLELELLLKRGQLDEAGRSAERLITRFTGSAGIMYQAGVAAYRLKNYPLAHQRFEESDKLFASRKTRRWLAKTLTNLGRFDDAEGMLLNLIETDPYCRVDLAWLYERKGDGRAKQQVSLHLSRYPNDKRALSQQIRLAAQELDEAEVIEQVSILDELGEAIPDELIPRYVSALVASGKSDEARRFIGVEQPKMSRRVLLDLAWTCHRLQMHDMAFELFVLVLEQQSHNFKMLNTLDYSAKRAGREIELADLYESMGPKQKSLYGRAKKLRASATK